MTTSSIPHDTGASSPKEPSSPGPDAATLQQDLEAVRIQVAAVMAQQVALTEKEAELSQRRIELERQEKQIAGHLEARNLKLNQLHERIRADRQRLIEEKAAWKTQRKGQLAELNDDRKMAREAERKAEAERLRLHALRRRLRKRWKQNFAAEQAQLRRDREQILNNQKEQLRQSEETNHKVRALAQDRLAFNSSVELGKRELQDAWLALRSHERLHENKAKELEDRATVVARDFRLLADQQVYWQHRKSLLEKECEGLENRVRNLRNRLAEERLVATNSTAFNPSPQKEPVDSEFPLAKSSVIAAELPHADSQDRERKAVQLYMNLADQRSLLFEQVLRLLNSWQSWLSEREALESELTARTNSLLDREQSLAINSRAMDSLNIDIQQRQSSLARAEERLEAKHSELRVQEIQLTKERNCLFAVEKVREEQIAAYRAHLVDLRRRWLVRRRQELKRVHEELARSEAIRSQLIIALEANRQRSSTLECEARRLAEKALALEEYKLETLAQAPDAVRAEQRIRRLRRRWARLYAAGERRIQRERQVLVNEAARLDQLGTDLGHQAASLAKREADLFDSQTGAEIETLKEKEIALMQKREIQSLSIHLKVAEQQTNQLRDEIECLIHVLLPDDSAPALALMNAA